MLPKITSQSTVSLHQPYARRLVPLIIQLAPDTLDKYLDKAKHLGKVEMGTVDKEEKEISPDEAERQERIKRMPILEQCYNLMDFEAVARGVMKKSAWAYYSSGADDEIVRPPTIVKDPS